MSAISPRPPFRSSAFAAALLPAGGFWLAWTSIPPVNWIWPILAGAPFGADATANFIYTLNNLAHSYCIYAASVLAGNTVWRFALGGTLPLTRPTMFRRLGPHWAASLLTFLLTVMAPIRFIFHRYGRSIRERSAVIRASRAEEARLRGDQDIADVEAQGPLAA